MFGLKPRSETGMTVEEYAEARRLAMRLKGRWAVTEFCLCFLGFSFLMILGTAAMGFLHGFGSYLAIWWAFMEGAAAWSAMVVVVADFLFRLPPIKPKP
jgi:hypothetical protein